jgi:hypothetical protein
MRLTAPFAGDLKARLVERTDLLGALGVAVRGGRFVCPLPPGYDGQVSLCCHKGYVLVAHPTMPPLQCDPTTGEVKQIEDHHIAGIPGRFQLHTH